MEKISVIIPTHNREKLLVRAIKSVQQQTRTVDEIIVVSDGSTDNTETIVKEMSKKDDRIKLIAYYPGHNGNYARNKGIEMSTGNFIAFLDDDDEWLPQKTELQMKVFETKEEVGLVYSAQNCIYEKENIKFKTKPRLSGDLSKRVFEGTGIGTPSQVMIRKEVLDKAGTFDLELGALQDFDLWIRCCQVTQVDFVPEVCINYYNALNTDKVSSKTDKYIDAIYYIRRKYDEEITKYGQEFVKQIDSKNELRIARRCLKNNQKKEARTYAYASWKIKRNKETVKFLIASYLPRDIVLKIHSKMQ